MKTIVLTHKTIFPIAVRLGHVMPNRKNIRWTAHKYLTEIFNELGLDTTILTAEVYEHEQKYGPVGGYRGIRSKECRESAHSSILRLTGQDYAQKFKHDCDAVRLILSTMKN